MDSKWNNLTSPSAAHPETMDVLSKAWCNFAVQTLNPQVQPLGKSLLLIDTPITTAPSDPFPVSVKLFLVYLRKMK